jgi:hypothetical protein
VDADARLIGPVIVDAEHAGVQRRVTQTVHTDALGCFAADACLVGFVADTRKPCRHAMPLSSVEPSSHICNTSPGVCQQPA